MERLTPSKYSSLAEAYVAVYDEDLRSKLNEEQEIQEFLELVNYLVEEGYDLSEYTYDELYENWKSKAASSVWNAIKGAVKTGWKGTTVQSKEGPKFVPGAEQEVKAAIANTLRRGVKIGVPVGIAAAADQWATGGRVRGALGQQIQNARQAAHGDKPSTARPEPQRPKSSGNPLGLNQDVDLFDLIKGHLLDEGYADTEEAALKIMSTMSEEWKNNIIKDIV